MKNGSKQRKASRDRMTNMVRQAREAAHVCQRCGKRGEFHFIAASMGDPALALCHPGFAEVWDSPYISEYS